jgi:hypothetical protein
MKRIFQNLLIFILSLSVIALAAIALTPSWRKEVQNYFQPDQRQVLASVVGRFIASDTEHKAVKSIDPQGVFIEVFEETEDGALKLLHEIRTGHPHDGQFNFKGQVSRLVSFDVDNDGVEEILVPTFDQELRPRLSVYKYQSEVKVFQEIPPPPLP